MATQTTISSNTQIARVWLTQRLESLNHEAAVIQGRAAEVERLIGELDETLPAFAIPAVATASLTPDQPRRRYERRTPRGMYGTLRNAVLAAVRSSRSRGLRLSEIRDAIAADGIVTHRNYISTLLSEQKRLGRIIHNPHTGRHRWAGEATAERASTAAPPRAPTPPVGEVPRSGPFPRQGVFGPNRLAIRDVLKAASGGMTNAGIRLACAARGITMDSNLIGATLHAERRLGNIRFDEATRTFHWTNKDQPER